MSSASPDGTSLPRDAAGSEAPPVPPGVPEAAPRTGKAEDPSVLPEGRFIANYEVLGELGRGGMGVVYKARQKGLNRLVALKMVLAGEHAGPNELARFRSEAEALALLQHPNIVQVHEVGEHDGHPFFSLEFCPGGSLATKLAGMPLPPQEAAGLVQVLARAVQAAHQAGVVHRDLKPANVLLAADGTPKITDFGLAKKLDAAGQTASGAILGTPSYMAPEQAAGKGKAVGPAADVYALGAILYECLTGRPPFRAPTPLDTVLQVLSDEPVPPRQLQPKTPRDLETVCLKCLEKEPRKRYASAGELGDDLGHFRAGEPVQARPVGRAEQLLKWARRRPALAGMAALAVLTAVLGSAGVGTLLQLRQTREQRDRAETALQAEAEARRTALAEAGRAAEAERTALAERGRAEGALYVNRILRAHFEWLGNDVARAEQVLDDCPAALRQWEWRYVKRLCHTDLFTLKGHTGAVLSVCWSPDGRRLASAGRDGTIKVWDAANGQEALALKGHYQPVSSLCWCPTGQRLASASYDQTVKVWDAQTGQEQLTLRGHIGYVTGVCFSPDGRRLASASGDVGEGEVKVWDARTGQEQRTLKEHTGPVQSVCFSPDGRRLASASWDGAVKVWDAQTGQEALTLKGHKLPVNSVCFSPDGRRLGSAGRDGTARVWDAATGQQAPSLQGHTDVVDSVCWSPDGKRLASASGDRTVKVWEAEKGQEVLSLQGHTGPVHTVCWSPDGQRLATASDDCTVKVWEAEKGQRALSLEGDGGLVCWSPDGQRLATASFDRTMKVWDAAKGRQTLAFQGHTGLVHSVCWSPDGKRLASAGGETGKPGEVKVWDAASGQGTLTLKGHAGDVSCACWSPDGQRLASAGEGLEEKGGMITKRWGEVKVWDAASGREVRTLKVPLGQVGSVCWSPDGKRLASTRSYLDQGQVKGEVKVWDVASGQQAPSLKGGGGLCVCWSPDGQRLASADLDGTVKVWDVASGQQALSLQGHTRWVHSVCWSPDGKRLASASEDKTVKVWDAASGQEALSLREHAGPVRCVCWSPDGNRLASASMDMTVKVWDATPLGDSRNALPTGR
jgi:WD40 repeat protein/tRNA A-37 threonylcarbamoyl transferase component Bud32